MSFRDFLRPATANPANSANQAHGISSFRGISNSNEANSLRSIATHGQVAPSQSSQEAESNRQCVIEMLNNTPGIRYAYAHRSTTDAVIVTLGVRGVATCELSIPKDRWDPFLFLAFLNEQVLH